MIEGKAGRRQVSKDTKRERKQEQKGRGKGTVTRGKTYNRHKPGVVFKFTPNCSAPISLRQERMGQGM